jgi:ornithine carbamoyltransferase
VDQAEHLLANSLGDDLHGRSLLRDTDLSATEIHHLIELAAQLKTGKREGVERHRMTGRMIALVFEKPSTRTRCAFEVAAHDQGAHVTYLDQENSHIGGHESIKDTARVLGRLYDGILYRGHLQSSIETLDTYAGVPVWNGLTVVWHPTQALCDLLTIREHSAKPWSDISVAYLGDGRSNVANSLRVAGATVGMQVRVVSPKELRADDAIIDISAKICNRSGGLVVDTDDVGEGVDGVDFVYTDVWVRIGEPVEQWRDRVELMREYRVDMELLAQTRNPAVKFLHCLPALHDGHSRVGAQIQAETGLASGEVSNEVFESAHSLVFQQAENRMHTIKALMIATLAT